MCTYSLAYLFPKILKNRPPKYPKIAKHAYSAVLALLPTVGSLEPAPPSPLSALKIPGQQKAIPETIRICVLADVYDALNRSHALLIVAIGRVVSRFLNVYLCAHFLRFSGFIPSRWTIWLIGIERGTFRLQWSSQKFSSNRNEPRIEDGWCTIDIFFYMFCSSSSSFILKTSSSDNLNGCFRCRWPIWILYLAMFLLLSI